MLHFFVYFRSFYLQTLDQLDQIDKNLEVKQNWKHHPLRAFLYSIYLSRPELFSQFSNGNYSIPVEIPDDDKFRSFVMRGYDINRELVEEIMSSEVSTISPSIKALIKSCPQDIPILICEIIAEINHEG